MYPDDGEHIQHFRKNGRIDKGWIDGKRETEIRLSDDGTLDEIVTDEVHGERMDDDAYWMSINGLHFWFRAVKRGQLDVTWFPDDAKRIAVKDGEAKEPGW